MKFEYFSCLKAIGVSTFFLHAFLLSGFAQSDIYSRISSCEKSQSRDECIFDLLRELAQRTENKAPDRLAHYCRCATTFLGGSSQPSCAAVFYTRNLETGKVREEVLRSWSSVCETGPANTECQATLQSEPVCKIR